MPTEAAIPINGQSADAAANPPQPGLPVPQPRIAVCPYCGEEVGTVTQCPHCKGLLDPLSRQASQNAMGPWAIRDEAAPFRPGFSLETLRHLIARGKVTASSVLRGPGTRQFWLRASQVPGVANMLGVCHSCRGPATATEPACRSCGARFAVESDRQFLGLSPVRLLPGHATPEQIAAASLAEVRPESPRKPLAARQSLPTPPIQQTFSQAEAIAEPAVVEPRPSQSGGVWRLAAVLLGVMCAVLVIVMTVMIFVKPEWVEGVRGWANPNK